MSNSYLIKSATILQESSTFHKQQLDLHIVDGQIHNIGKNLIVDDAEIIAGQELIVTAGWTDLRCHLTDPGLEHKDTLQGLLDAAAAGGFTSIVTLPHSEPYIDNKSMVNYLLQTSSSHMVNLLPTGVLSEKNNKENMAELYDMFSSGAVAFTNGDSEVGSGLLKKSLLYTKPFAGKIWVQPIDKSLEQGGVVNESEATISTGLKSSSSMAEYTKVQQSLEIAEYCKSPIHFSCISCAESVVLVQEAKKKGVQVTCDVAIANLCFTDKEVLTFDENFKLYPPLRTEQDRIALVAGVNNGTIDAICSNHTPQNIECKEVEFSYAEFGALSLQFVWPWYLKYLAKEIDLAIFVEVLTQKPNTVIGIKNEIIGKEKSANLVVLDKKESWTFDVTSNKSVSKNTHEFGQEQIGKVIAIFHNKSVKK